ncbi:MAG: hypothetical protein GWN18_13480, partial [Thermoplasmata archaeon]|nr:hypothetical protein [Thermoplasmata archaeon]NIS13072.1 hypothetical protein [Thermoplasmata archaeon]NIS20975.1 hypothetical protein [Thermoplasmata archaeon]NIT78288.1 hypothetical protein [Thermoplasmata archaeon]NIU50028.1 hypothetical protein [Thermoplasmata archaeon]
DVNGTSRVMILETADLSLRADHVWRDNATLLFMTTDGRDLVCVDELGGVTVISGLDWQGSQRFQGFELTPTATSNQYTRSNEPWLLGFENGSYQVWRCCPWELSETNDMGEGPIQALTNIWDLRAWFSMMAMPRGEGSELLISRTYYQWGIVEYIADPYQLDTPVSMITQDPAVHGQLWVGFTDGTLALLNVTFIEDEAPEAYILEPENNKEHFGDSVHFSGNYSDDHDRIVWIRVRVDDDEWHDVDWADGEWSWDLDISGMKDETNHRVTVLAFDGRKESTGDAVLINIFEPREDERGIEFGFWFFFWITVIALLILVPIWLYVRRRAAAGDDGRKGSDQD